MITAADVERISIRGRLALAVTCLENVCREWNICSPALERLLTHLWTFTDSMRLDEWVLETCNLSPNLEDRFDLALKRSHVQVAGDSELSRAAPDIGSL